MKADDRALYLAKVSSIFSGLLLLVVTNIEGDFQRTIVEELNKERR